MVEDRLELRVEDDSYRPERAIAFGGVAMIQGPPEIEEIGALRAFGPSDVLRASPELARHWPPIPEHCVVFRVEPFGFASAALTVVASSIQLVTAGVAGRSSVVCGGDARLRRSVTRPPRSVASKRTTRASTRG